MTTQIPNRRYVAAWGSVIDRAITDTQPAGEPIAA